MKSMLTEGDAVLQKEMREIEYRGETYTYEHHNVKDLDTGIEYTTNDMDFDNLERIYEQYRKRHDIPSPAELKALREKYGMSAAGMSRVLGLGENQYRLYEDGEMPSEAIGKMLRSVQTPAVFLRYVEGCKLEMTEDEYNKLCRKIEKTIINEIRRKPNFQWLHEFFSFGGMMNKVAM